MKEIRCFQGLVQTAHITIRHALTKQKNSRSIEPSQLHTDINYYRKTKIDDESAKVRCKKKCLT